MGVYGNGLFNGEILEEIIRWIIDPSNRSRSVLLLVLNESRITEIVQNKEVTDSTTSGQGRMVQLINYIYITLKLDY